MSNSPFEANPAFSKLGDETRQVVTQAFDAMSNWRTEMAQMGQKNSDAVFDKMAEAAKSLGWPTHFVELSRQQMQNASKMQVSAIDQVMDIWEKQITSVGTTGQMPAFPAFPNFAQGGGMPTFPGMPNIPGMGSAPGNPMQFWVQAAEMWQKGWQQAISGWMEAQQNAVNSATDKGDRKS